MKFYDLFSKTYFRNLKDRLVFHCTILFYLEQEFSIVSYIVSYSIYIYTVYIKKYTVVKMDILSVDSHIYGAVLQIVSYDIT